MTNQVEKLFESFPDVELAYQFGSSIKHPRRKAKDIDVGVLLKGGLSPENQFEIFDALTDRLAKLFKKKVDVSILNKTSPMLNYQILKNGKLLYGNVRRAKQFVVETMTRYFDYLPMHQFFVQHLEKRLGKQSHG